MTVEYDPGADALYLTGGTDWETGGTAVSEEDLYAADQANGWGRVTRTPLYPYSAYTYWYNIKADLLYIGKALDGSSVTTFFRSTKSIVTFQHVWARPGDGRMELGELNDEGWPEHGSVWLQVSCDMVSSTYFEAILWDSVVVLGGYRQTHNRSTTSSGGQGFFYNTVMLMSKGAFTDAVFGAKAVISTFLSPTIQRSFIANTVQGYSHPTMRPDEHRTIRTTRAQLYDASQPYEAQRHLHVVDPTLAPTQANVKTDDGGYEGLTNYVYLEWTFRPTLLNEAGEPLEGRTVVVTEPTLGTVASYTTNADGQPDEPPQLRTVQWTGDDETETRYGPWTITVAGDATYQPLVFVLDSIDSPYEDPIVQLAWPEAPTEAEVRAGVSYFDGTRMGTLTWLSNTDRWVTHVTSFRDVEKALMRILQLRDDLGGNVLRKETYDADGDGYVDLGAGGTGASLAGVTKGSIIVCNADGELTVIQSNADGYVPTIQADRTVAWEALPPGADLVMSTTSGHVVTTTDGHVVTRT